MSEHPLTKELSGYGPDHLTAALWIARAAPELDRLAEVNADATAKLETVEGLPGKWEEDRKALGFMSAGIGDETKHLRDAIRGCAAELTAALASPGPSLRERVEKAIAEMHDLAKDMHNPAQGETAYAEAISHCADLVQAALEGE